MNKIQIIPCMKCKATFTKNKNLYVHLRKYHDEEPCPSRKKPEEMWECGFCGKKLSYQSSLQRHMNIFHIAGNDHDYIKSKKISRLNCPNDTCIKSFSNYDSLRNHLQVDHSIEIELENVKFNSLEDFETWKNKVQLQTLSFYTLDTGSKILSDNTQKKYYNCHRSYSYKPKGNNRRSLKSTGSNKMGKACPSRMEVSVNENMDHGLTVQVKFWKTHCGHLLELGHTVIDKESRAQIAGKLREGLTFDHILDSIRDTEAKEIEDKQRLYLIKRKDLHNIVRDYNIEYSTKRDQNDATMKFQGNDSIENMNHEIWLGNEEAETLIEMDEQNIEAQTNRQCSTTNSDITKKAEMILGLSSSVEISEENLTLLDRHLDKCIDILNRQKLLNL